MVIESPHEFRPSPGVAQLRLVVNHFDTLLAVNASRAWDLHRVSCAVRTDKELMLVHIERANIAREANYWRHARIVAHQAHERALGRERDAFESGGQC